MAFFEVNESLCRKDSICAKLCVANIIKLDENTNYPYIDEKDADRCIKCGQCVSFCPFNACSIASVPNPSYVDKTKLPTAESASLLLRSRRSIRMFKKNGLEREKIMELLNIANMAPTAKNAHYIRWIVLEDKVNLNKATELVMDYFAESLKKIGKTQPRMAAMLKFLIKSYKSGQNVVFRGAPQLVIAVAPDSYQWKMEDGIISLTYLEIAAHAHGVGMCWAGYLTDAARNYKPLREYLGLSDDEFLCGAQMMGYPLLGVAKKSPDKAPANVSFPFE